MKCQINYFCNKISEVKQLDLYIKYQDIKNELNNNQQYVQLTKQIKDIDRKSEQYQVLKKEVREYECELLMVERDLNRYINHIINQYNNLLVQNVLDKKVSKER